MHAKLKNIILTLTLIGIGLGIFSYSKMYEFFYQEFYFPAILAILLITFLFLPKNLKIKSRFLNLTVLGIGILFVTLTTQLTLDYFGMKRTEKILTEYHELDCEKITDRFTTDLANNEMKYFSSGLVGSGKLSENIKKYGIENFDLGCMVYDNLNCYNALVSTYLKKEQNITINELYE
ncbi:hypothetical protein [Cellulophaga sp. E6(2014)]|uniref:hypothetical protein n=1 Tax=Cellulophaga sp. E6(2014) TaxID=1495334 RepID=UPI00051D8808|nr:hypothetical protein [Cellulophaga sp. E6(2014)]KGK29185.1 hypothetical protein EL45_16690 [Cellulophaga sp. E6(2014)]